MRTWEQAKVAKWESMTPAEQDEFDNYGPEVAAELRAAELVYQTRKDLGLTQSQFAARSGLGQNYISALENGSRTPTISTLAKIAAAAGKTLNISIA